MHSTAPIRVVSTSDPAIDRDRTDFEKYTVSRDLSYVVNKRDKQPAIYHVRRIPRRLVLKYILEAHDPVTQRLRAFECGVVRVERPYEDDGSQSKADFAPQWTDSKSDKLQIMSDEEVERFPAEDVLEIGEVAFQHAFLRPGSDSYYEVSRTVRSLLLLADRPPAAKILQELDKLREKGSEPSPPSPDTSGEPDTAATA
jgi:hypothetical protein